MSATQTINGIDLPAAGTWKVDPGHAEVGFIGRHFMLTKVRGRFTGVDATVVIGHSPDESSIEATIDMASVHSGDGQRDDHLKSPDFFDVESHPTGVFRSTSVTWNGDSTGTIEGTLQIKDVEHPVTLETTFVGALEDPWGNARSVFEATARVNREDWGLTWNMALETGGWLVSKEITLELHLELVKQA